MPLNYLARHWTKPFGKAFLVQQSARAGLLYAAAGFATLSVGDGVAKTMAGEWPVVAVAATRFVIGAIGLSVLLMVKEGASAFIPTNPRLQILRGFSLALATLSFFSAIFLMPLAETMAITFIAPLLTAILSGPILGEKVRLPVWLASLVALVGVLVILRPNWALLGWPALLPIISASFFALMVVLNRKSAGQSSPLSMQVYIAIVAGFVLCLAAIAGNVSGVPALDFTWPSWSVLGRCAFVACTASLAHWLMFIGTTKAGAAQVAPASYVQMLVAVGMGWWLFGDVPDPVTWIGAAIIISAGLYLWRYNLAQEAKYKRV